MQTLKRDRGASGKRRASGRVLLAISLLLGSGLAFFGVDAAKVSAAACTNPATDLGTDEITITVPATATYTVWTRMKAPDASHNTIDLQIDTDNCYNVGGGAFTATGWESGAGNWVKYEDGDTTKAISLQLNQGSHTLKYIGTQAGVEVDRVILSSDATCTPTGTGTNCQSGDSTPPTVNLLTPEAGQTVTGNVTLTATAADAGGTVAKVEFLVDGNSVNGTGDTSSPFEHNWNSGSVSNGSHTVSARATDASGNTATSDEVTITTNNAPGSGPARGDLNDNGTVDLTDLSILLSNWNKTGVPAAQGDVNSSGKVDLTDLSTLLSNWGT